jgi:hypothetical protein
MQLSTQQKAWLKSFTEDARLHVSDPFILTTVISLAAVECGFGASVITGKLPDGQTGINEIGYKALAGKPRVKVLTHEAVKDGKLEQQFLDFRLFRGDDHRREQIVSLLWLMRSSKYYDSARLMFLLTLYSGYAPGRTAGHRSLIEVYNALAADCGTVPVRFLTKALRAASDVDPDTEVLNHSAVRGAVLDYLALCDNEPKVITVQ